MTAMDYDLQMLWPLTDGTIKQPQDRSLRSVSVFTVCLFDVSWYMIRFLNLPSQYLDNETQSGWNVATRRHYKKMKLLRKTSRISFVRPTTRSGSSKK